MAPSKIKVLKSYPKTSQYLKFDLKLMFWSLVIHRYQKHFPLITIFAARRQGIELVIDGNFITKQMKIRIF